jgi:cytochrome P450
MRGCDAPPPILAGFRPRTRRAPFRRKAPVSTLTPTSTPPAPPPPRPASPNRQGGPGILVRRAVFAALTGRAVLRPLFALLRRFAPVLRVGKRVVVSRHAEVLEVLDRDGDFTIAEVNGPAIERINGPFILAMDRGDTYERDHAALRATARYEDVERVRGMARESAARRVEAARPSGRIEAVQALTRAVPADVVADYFGFPGPDRATLVRWLRSLFQEAFANPTADPYVRAASDRAFAEVRDWVLPEIARRRAEGVDGAEDVMGRMIALGGPERPWADDDWVRRNLAGLVVGAVDTTSRFSILALDELLRRPRELDGARTAAADGDLDAVRQYAWEAVRFNPHTPVMARFCPRETVLAAGTRREKRVPAGASMVVGTLSAMFDPEAFPQPRRFRIDRDVRSYLHFGWGMHRCFGLAINHVQIPEILAALLRLPRLRRARGAAGRVKLDGPFPDRLVLRFG